MKQHAGFGPAAGQFDSSRFSLRFPQCVSLRDGSNTRSTCRLSARRTPMRAIMVGPISSTTRSRASTAGLPLREMLFGLRKAGDVVAGIAQSQ